MQKQKFISKKWFILLAIILLLIPMTVYAAIGDAISGAASTAAAQVNAANLTGQSTDIFNQVLQSMVTFLSKILEVLQKILWPIFLAIGGLLGNDVLFGSGMEERLLDIWAQIRNLVNIGFVVILLGLALYNVSGFAQENYQLKTMLPKIVVALILINFTFIGFKFILDVSNVMTHVVFTLPSSISAELQNTKLVYTPADAKKLTDADKASIKEADDNVERVCTSMFGHPNVFQEKLDAITASGKKNALEDPDKFYCKLVNKKYELTDSGKTFFGKYSSKNSALILAVQMMKIVDVDKLSDSLKTGTPSISKLSFELLFSVVLYVIYGVAYVVLFIVLLARLVYLWLVIGLSPLIILSVMSGRNFLGDKFTIGSILHNIFVPVYIGTVLSIGYILLQALQESTTIISTDVSLKIFDMETAGITDLQTMIVGFGAVAFIWVGVFAAADKSIAQSVVQSIQGKLRTAGAKILRAARFVPIVPAGAGPKGRVSFQQVANQLNAPLRRLEEKYGTGGTGVLTKSKIQRLERKGTSPQELQKYLAQGITQPRFRPAFGKVLRAWKKGTAAQKQERRRILKLLPGGVAGAAARGFERTGALTGGQARAIERYAQGNLPSATGRRLGERQQPRTKAQTAIDERVAAQRQIKRSANLGLANSADVDATKDNATLDAHIKKADTKARLKEYAAIDAAYTPLTDAKDSGVKIKGLATVNDTTVKPHADNLKTQLTDAKTELTKQKLSKPQIKNILQKIVDNALGAKAGAFYGTAPGKEVQTLINQ